MAKNYYIIGYILIFYVIHGLSKNVIWGEKETKPDNYIEQEYIDTIIPQKQEEKTPNKLLRGFTVKSDRDCLKEELNNNLGVRERGGNNKGKEVMMYLNSAGIFTPAPWCAAFLVYIFKLCGIQNPESAWSPSWATHSSGETRWQIRQNHPLPTRYEQGMIFTLYYNNLGRVGHVGAIIEIDGNTAKTIEGNVTIRGTRETGDGNDGVMSLKRDMLKMYNIRVYNKPI